MALYVLSLGGSIVVPGAIDIEYLKEFKQFIDRRIEQGDRFILTVGGGKTARNYQAAAERVSGVDDEERDWLGIHATRLNAHLLRTIFKGKSIRSLPKILTNRCPTFQNLFWWVPAGNPVGVPIILPYYWQSATRPARC